VIATTGTNGDINARDRYLGLDRAIGRQCARQEPEQGIPDRSRCIVPTIVQLELSKWLVREVGEEQADQVIAYTQKCRVVPLDTAIALLAAELHR
jgi:toxin FitB